MQSTAIFLKVFLLGIACLLTPKAIANPMPTTILPSDLTLGGKSTETPPSQGADADSREETKQAIPKGSAVQYAPVDRSSFNPQMGRSASDLLPDQVQSNGSITAQTDAPPPGDSTTSAQSNPAKPADTTPENDAAAEKERKELAKRAQNPLADLISVPFQNNTNFGVGPLDRTQNVLNFQPVIPVSIRKDWLLDIRTILPVIYQPEPPQGGGGTFGLGDINPQFYFVPKTDSHITWGVGPTFVFPTATDSVLGQGKWSIGPAAVIVVTTEHLVFGAVANNVWSVAGDGNRANVSQLTFQYFINYNLDKGWYLVSSPILTANWEASGGNQWTVPFGGGFGRIFAIGKQPVNASLQAFWNVAKPNGGPDWSLRAQLQFLFPR
jgi:hypothetical protein